MIVSDERDTCLKSLDIPNVYVRVCPGLNLENAFDFISCDALFGTGVLFVVLCGTYSFVRWTADPDCHNRQCSQPLLIPSVIGSRETDLFSMAMTSARNLHHSIMLNSAKDDLIFGHVLPIGLTPNAKFLAMKHQRYCKHKSTHPFLNQGSVEMFVTLCTSMLLYNGWTDRFATELGYSSWNVSAGFFSESTTTKKTFQKFDLTKLANDGVHFTPETQEVHKAVVSDLVQTCMQTLNDRQVGNEFV